MSVHVTDDKHVAMFDSVTGFAFGPTFDSADDVEEFLDWLDEHCNGTDARTMASAELESAQSRWLAWREAQSS